MAGSTPVPARSAVPAVRQPGAEGSLLSPGPHFPAKLKLLLQRSSALKGSREVRSHKKFCFLGKILPITLRNPDEFQRKGLTGDTRWEQESRGNEEEVPVT